MEATRVVDRRRSVELHQTPVIHVPDHAPGHSQVAGHVHVHVHVQRVDRGPRASPNLDHGLDPGQKVVHDHIQDQGVAHSLDQGVAHGLDQGVAHGHGQEVAHGRGQEVAHSRDLGVGHGQDPRVGHTLGVDQDLGRVHHALGLDQRVDLGVADRLILDQGNE